MRRRLDGIATLADDQPGSEPRPVLYDLRRRFDTPQGDAMRAALRNLVTAVTKPPLDTVTKTCYADSVPFDPDELAALREIADRQTKWADDHGIAFIRVDRAGRQTIVHTPAVVGERDCKHCGERFWFDAIRTRRPGKYCSPACRQGAYRHRHPRPEKQKPMAELAAKCEQCGKTIPEQLRRGRDTGRPARFCSAACRQKAHRARQRVPA